MFLFTFPAAPGVNWRYYSNIHRHFHGGETTLDALYRNQRYPDHPSDRGKLDKMDAPRGLGVHFGQMMFGWFVAPSDGEYTFFTACDDACDLYMSADEGKEHIRRVASQRRWSGHNQWDK